MKTIRERLIDHIVEMGVKRVSGKDTISKALPLATTYPIDPLASNLNAASANAFVERMSPPMLAWWCVPAETRHMALRALRSGKDVIKAHMDAKDTRSTVMQMVCLAIAGTDAEACIRVFQIAMDPKPEARKQIGTAIAFLMLEDGLARLHHQTMLEDTENDPGGQRYSLIQIALLAQIVAKGPRSEEVGRLVQQMTEIHGEAATVQLAAPVMNPLIWAAELEAPNAVHMA